MYIYIPIHMIPDVYQGHCALLQVKLHICWYSLNQQINEFPYFGTNLFKYHLILPTLNCWWDSKAWNASGLAADNVLERDNFDMTSRNYLLLGQKKRHEGSAELRTQKSRTWDTVWMIRSLTFTQLPIGSMYAIYMVTFTINIPPMLAYIPAPWILWVIIDSTWQVCDIHTFLVDWSEENLGNIDIGPFAIWSFWSTRGHGESKMTGAVPCRGAGAVPCRCRGSLPDWMLCARPTLVTLAKKSSLAEKTTETTVFFLEPDRKNRDIRACNNIYDKLIN